MHIWQNDRDLLRATAVTRGWNGYRNISPVGQWGSRFRSTWLPATWTAFAGTADNHTIQNTILYNNTVLTPSPPQPVKFPGTAVPQSHNTEYNTVQQYCINRFTAPACKISGTADNHTVQNTILYINTVLTPSPSQPVKFPGWKKKSIVFL